MLSSRILDTWKPVYNCLRLLFSDLDEECLKDVIQDAMIEFITNPNKELSVKNPFSYILKIAIRKTWKTIEEQKKLAISQLEIVEQYQSIQEINESRIAMEAAIETILDSFAVLNEKEIKLVTMRFFNKEDFRTIAQLLGYSSADVARNAIGRIIERLRQNIYQKNKNLDWWNDSPYFSNFFQSMEVI